MLLANQTNSGDLFSLQHPLNHEQVKYKKEFGFWTSI